jgi:coenzyme Q-binding protein COQ10
MPKFDTTRRVQHSPEDMFALVADVERYPEFLPMCEALTIRSRKERGHHIALVADMTAGYKAIRETFTSLVFLKPDELAIDVRYLEGPFRYLENRWRFQRAEGGGCNVHFMIDYEFKSRLLGGLMGTMFGRAFGMYSSAFEKRADRIYGAKGPRAA